MRTWLYKNKEKGFTLAEMLVAVSVFILIMAATVAIFVSVVRAQRKAQALRAVLDDSRYSLELMARQIRMAKIDYDAYGGSVTEPQETLYLIDSQGTSHIFSFRSNRLEFDGGVVTSDNVFLDDLKFYINPEASPYTSGSEDEHSRVTIVFSATGKYGQSDKPQEESHIDIQTTVSNRVYER